MIRNRYLVCFFMFLSCLAAVFFMQAVPASAAPMLDSGYIEEPYEPPSQSLYLDDTPEGAVIQLRNYFVFFLYGIIPLYTGIFLIWQFMKWISGLIIRAV